MENFLIPCVGSSIVAHVMRYYTIYVIMIGTSLLGLLCGIIGCVVVAKRESLLGDGIAHMAYPGMVASFYLASIKSVLVQLIGALMTATLGILLIQYIKQRTHISYDSILATVLSGSFSIGLVLMSLVQQQAGAKQSGLTRILFGQPAALMKVDLVVISVFIVAILIVLKLYWHHIVSVIFDAVYAQSIGLSVRTIQNAMALISTIGVLLAIQSVGVILMCACLVGPAISARQWAHTFKQMMVISAMIGVFSSMIGTGISSIYSSIPTGPAIVVTISCVVLVSVLIAPKRGILWRAIG